MQVVMRAESPRMACLCGGSQKVSSSHDDLCLSLQDDEEDALAFFAPAEAARADVQNLQVRFRPKAVRVRLKPEAVQLR